MRLGIASGDRVLAKNSPDGKHHWGGAGWVRLGQYEPYLMSEGIQTYIGTLVWNKDHFSIDIGEGGRYLIDVDIVYLQRLMHAGLADHIKQARANGQKVINDLDDWYWGLSTQNHAFMSSHPKTNPNENVNHYKKVLSASDIVTVSTPYLADRIKQFVHCPIEIIMNTVEVDRFHVKEHTDSDVPIVGWVGSVNHRSGDLEVLSGIIDRLYRDKEIRLQHSGHHPGNKTIASSWNLSDDDIIMVPATDPEFYPSILTMDVGLAPLTDIPFNHAKSDIKLLEYSASGIPWVGSGLSAYTELVKEWGIGRVVRKNKNWATHLRALRNPDTRSAEGRALREAVRQRDIGVGAKLLSEFLRSL